MLSRTGSAELGRSRLVLSCLDHIFSSFLHNIEIYFARLFYDKLNHLEPVFKIEHFMFCVILEISAFETRQPKYHITVNDARILGRKRFRGMKLLGHLESFPLALKVTVRKVLQTLETVSLFLLLEIVIEHLCSSVLF